MNNNIFQLRIWGAMICSCSNLTSMVRDNKNSSTYRNGYFQNSIRRQTNHLRGLSCFTRLHIFSVPLHITVCGKPTQPERIHCHWTAIILLCLRSLYSKKGVFYCKFCFCPRKELFNIERTNKELFWFAWFIYFFSKTSHKVQYLANRFYSLRQVPFNTKISKVNTSSF